MGQSQEGFIDQDISVSCVILALCAFRCDLSVTVQGQIHECGGVRERVEREEGGAVMVAEPAQENIVT